MIALSPVHQDIKGRVMRLISVALTFILLNGSAQAENPFLTVIGDYVGLGEIVTPQGKTLYSSLAYGFTLSKENNNELSTTLNLGYFRYGKPLAYTLKIDWDANNIGTATISYDDDNYETIELPGVGYCALNKCHLNFVMDGKSAEETITILEDGEKIERMGSLQFIDQAGTPRMVYWTENMAALNFPMATILLP